MEKIKWALYNSEDFQNFCNALLSFEVSKKFVPFTAPGRDGGTDGSFRGTYDGSSGKWRFQYKFHLTARKVSYNALKKDVASELKKVTDEDFLVILTNTEVLPQELKTLNQLGENKINNRGKPTRLIIWDGAKIFTLYLQYPILETWLTSNFKSAQLQEFKNYYGTALIMDGYDPATLNNRFIAREEQLRVLADFLSNADQHVAFIAGEAGIGKSRLVIEFFKQIIEPDDQWQALILVNYNIAYDLLTKSLAGLKNIMLLIEDAHEYSSQQIEELKRLIKVTRENKLKLIFTFRKIEFSEATRLTRNLNSPELLAINLTQLSEKDTEQLFIEEVKGTYLINYIPQLVEISRGRPVLIVALLNASKQQKFIPQAKNDQFLRDYVNKYFDSFIHHIGNQTNLSALRLRNFLYLICLLEPIPVKDEKWLQNLCDAEKLELEDVRFIFKQLDEQNFFSGKYQQELKPDYYSDILLSGADVQWLRTKFDLYEDYLPTIIKNLASVEEAGMFPGDDSLLDQILTGFVNGLYSCFSYEQLKKIVKTIDSLNGYKPVYATKVIDVYLKILTDPQHALYTHIKGVFSTKHYSFYPEYQATKSMLHDMLNHESQYGYVLGTLLRLADLIPDTGLFLEVFGYGFLDVVYRFSVKRQRFFAENTANELDDSNPVRVKFIINSYKSLLKLDFNSSSADRSGYTIKLHHFYIPDQESTKALRATLISNLSDFYFKTSQPELKILILDTLLDIPREIRSVGREKNNAYKTKDDTIAVLDFVDVAAATLPVELHRTVLNKLFWFKHFEIGGKLVDRVIQIEKKISPQNFTEQLIYILTMAEVNITDDFNLMKKELQESCRHLISNYDPEEIASGLVTIYAGPGELPYQLHDFLELLYEEYGGYLPAIYNFLWTNARAVCMQIGSGMLKAIYKKDGNEHFFWQKVELLETEATAQSFNVISHVFALGGEPSALNEKDLKLIQRIFYKRFPENNHWFALALPKFYNLNAELTQSMLIGLLDNCEQRDASIMFLFLFENYKDYYDQAKELLLKHTARFEIDSRIKGGLKKVIRKDGFAPVLEYLKFRVALKVEKIQSGQSWSGHDSLPHNEEGSLINELSQDEKLTILHDLIDWYVNGDFNTHTKYAGIHLVKYLNSYRVFSPEIAAYFQKKYEFGSLSQNQFIRLGECLQIFYKKNELLIATILGWFNAATMAFGTDDEFRSGIYMEAYMAITQVGGKHGKPGEPFPEDVELKNLLEQVTPNYHSTDEMRLLNSALNHVNHEISTTEERHRTDW